MVGTVRQNARFRVEELNNKMADRKLCLRNLFLFFFRLLRRIGLHYHDMHECIYF